MAKEAARGSILGMLLVGGRRKEYLSYWEGTRWTLTFDVVVAIKLLLPEKSGYDNSDGRYE